MAVHVPVHPRHIPQIHVSGDLVETLTALVLVAAIFAAAAMTPRLLNLPTRAEVEAASLVEFRIGERAARVSERQYLVDFRAEERNFSVPIVQLPPLGR